MKARLMVWEWGGGEDHPLGTRVSADGSPSDAGATTDQHNHHQQLLTRATDEGPDCNI